MNGTHNKCLFSPSSLFLHISFHNNYLLAAQRTLDDSFVTKWMTTKKKRRKTTDTEVAHKNWVAQAAKKGSLMLYVIPIAHSLHWVIELHKRMYFEWRDFRRDGQLGSIIRLWSLEQKAQLIYERIQMKLLITAKKAYEEKYNRYVLMQIHRDY